MSNRSVTLLAALCVASLTLTSCATQSEPQPVEQPAPLSCDPRVTADLPKPPVKPAGATIVQPVTPEEQAATEKFLSWASAWVDYGLQLYERALIAKNDCAERR